MFIYSMRASSVKFFSVIVLTLAVLTGLLVFGRGDEVTVYANSVEVDFSGIKTNEDRIRFISQFGVKVETEPCDSEEFRVPADFDRVIAGYNEIQKKQGLNIEKYKNKKVTRYTYSIKDYEREGKRVDDAVVNLVIYKGTVVACDISSSSPDGFVLPLVNL